MEKEDIVTGSYSARLVRHIAIQSMVESIGGACKQNGAIGDKETVYSTRAIALYFESMHVAAAEVYIRVW